MGKALSPIPVKRYFTIGEVAELCDVKPHVLRYWEQEFVQLRPMKRRGNRRYYQHHEVLMIRRIRSLLYDQGFTISGARNKLQEMVQAERELHPHPVSNLPAHSVGHPDQDGAASFRAPPVPAQQQEYTPPSPLQNLRSDLLEIRELLRLDALDE
ncbi:MAG: MerR family transcriptional regulator [Burkholderiaceae bacterium]|jgi:DNA-binding transcriptional MerR regulator|nr:MerR family transcriptional regulator [Burkholderiaceae bacterium]